MTGRRSDRALTVAPDTPGQGAGAAADGADAPGDADWDVAPGVLHRRNRRERERRSTMTMATAIRRCTTLALAAMLGGCASYQSLPASDKGMLIGAGTGAAIGAVAAGPVGAVVGAGVGGYTGKVGTEDRK